MIRTVRVADRGDRAVFSLRRNEPDIGFLQQIKAKRLRPGVVLGGNAEICFAATLQQILIEVSAANDVVSRFILRLHVGEQQFQLLVGNFPVGGVGRQVQIIQAQRFPVRDRNFRYAVAPVQIEKLRHARLDRQAPSHRAADTEL